MVDQNKKDPVEEPEDQDVDDQDVDDQDKGSPTDENWRGRALKAERIISRRKKQAAAESKELETLQTKLKEREDADKSELQLLTERLAEAEKKATQADVEMATVTVETALLMALSKAGAVDPLDALKLSDLANVQVTDGGVDGVDEAVASLTESKPYLFGDAEGQPKKPAPVEPGGGTAKAGGELKQSFASVLGQALKPKGPK